MKKLITIGTLFLVTFLFINTNVKAQNLGAGLAYGSNVEAIGIQVNGVHGFSDNLRGASDFTLFFLDQTNNVDQSYWTINANAHYLFMSQANTNVYGLGGLNYTSYDVTSSGVNIISTSEVGLNLGGGAEFGVGFGNLFVEAKYIISDLDQLVLGAGLRFGL